MIFVDARTGRPIATHPTRLASVAAIETGGLEAIAIVIAHTIEMSVETSPGIGIANGTVIANGLGIDRHSLIVDRSQDLNVGVLLGIVLALPIASKIAYPQMNVLSTRTHIGSTRRQKLKPMPTSERVSPFLLDRQPALTPLKRLTRRSLE